MPDAHRRLLLVSYFYPPRASVGGVRAAGLAKYISRLGWDVVVVAAPPPGTTVPPTPVPGGAWAADPSLALRLRARVAGRPDAALKDAVAGGGAPGGLRAALIDTAKALIAFPDQHRGWRRSAVAAGRALAAARPFDAVLSTSPPPTAHLAGRDLARSLRVPWVADFRDLWADDHNSTAPGWRRRLDVALEARVLRAAAALATVSAPLARQLAARHPAQRVATILNGFDPDDFAGEVAPSREFTLTHTGTFYQGRRDPAPLLAAVAALCRAGRIDRARTRLRFFARGERWLEQAVAAHGLGDVVEILPWVARADALRAQREAQVLLLLHWGGAREEGVYTGKVFEYLAARRPILAIGGGPGVLRDLLERTGAGTHVVEPAAIEAAIAAAWDEFVATGAVRWRGDAAVLDQYGHPRMAAEFAALLETALECSRSDTAGR